MTLYETETFSDGRGTRNFIHNSLYFTQKIDIHKNFAVKALQTLIPKNYLTLLKTITKN